MRKIIIGFVLTLITSAYLFPITFTFLPQGINSKILVGVFGIAAFVFNGIRKGALEISEPTLFSFLMASIFSVWCLYCVTATNTGQMEYATYFVSFFTWMAGAYGVYAALSMAYDKVDLEILTRYLALAGVFQCVSAVLIDNYGAVSNFVDKFYDGGAYYREHQRMYGIGAALDPGGVRFSAILIMIAHNFATNKNVRSNSLFQATDIGAFAIITIIGCVISRTTIIGAGMGLAYITISLFKLRKGGFITIRMLELYFVFLAVLAVIVFASAYFYRNSDTFNGYLRFGFEAFFNWVETGEFRTTSTDHLNTMWVWPEDMRTWFFGRGTFGVFENNTDIGYCNFTFYCGLVGMAIFSIYFLYCHLVLNRKFSNFLIASLLLCALTFIIWCKVTTDIFFLNALLFCVAADEMEEGALLGSGPTINVNVPVS